MQRLRQRLAARGVEALDEAMGGEHREPGILERHQAHQHVAVIALPAHLLGIGARGLIAVVAVGDQQLGVARRGLHRGDDRLVGDPPQAVDGALRVGGLAPRRLRGDRLERPPRRAGGVGVEREDRRHVGARGARQAQPVLLRARVRALVRAHPPRPVLLDAHPAEEPAPGLRHPVGAGVPLRVRPDRGLRVAHHGALQLPALEQLSGHPVGIGELALDALLPVGAALAGGGRPGEIHRDHVERGARDQRGPLRGVDHVVGRGHDVAEGSDHGEVVVQRAQGLNVSHRGAGP